MTKISDLTAITGASVDTAADLIPIVDMSLAGASRNKKILVSELGNALAAALAYTDEKAQDAIGAMIDSSLTYVDATPLLQRAALTGDVTASAGSNATTIANNAVSFAKFVAAPSAGVVWASGAANYAHNASGGGTTNFLRADGTWAAPPGTGGTFTAASTTEALTGTDTTKGITPDALAALWEQGSDVASAGTVSLGEGGYFNITGTTTITDIDFATDKAGRHAWLKFAGILTLTHNASTLILPTGANITTAAGDTACFISEGTDAVRCVAYQRADGTALAGGSSPAMSLISEVVTSGSQATVSFSSIATTWRDLVVMVRGRGSNASTSVEVRLQFNGDTGSNYDYGLQTNSGAAVNTYATTSIWCGYLTGSTAPSNTPAASVIEVPNYKGTTFNKTTISQLGVQLNTTGTNIFTGHSIGQWRSTAAINAVLVILSAGNFVDGSVVSLYGRM